MYDTILSMIKKAMGVYMLELKNVFKTYANKSETVIANQDISLKFPNNGLVFICGESGSGKTTLLNLIGGLDQVTSGNIYFNNEDICSYNEEKYANYRNQYIGYITQTYDLIDSFTVLDNVNLSLNLQGINDKDKSLHTLQEVGIDNLAKRKAKNLSGGQKQRVAIARALVKEPSIILADEPTGSLDSQNSKEIFTLLKKISENKLVIVVSHNQELANAFADRIITISDGIVTEDKIKKEITNIEEKLTTKHISKSKIKISNLIYNHKYLIIMLIVVLTIVALLSLLLTTINYNLIKTHATALKESNVNNVTITKINPQSGKLISFNQESQKYLTNFLQSNNFKYEQIGKIYHPQNPSLTPGDYSKLTKYKEENCYELKVVDEDENGLKTYQEPIYCLILNDPYSTTIGKEIHIIDQQTFLNLKTIGRYPSNPNEIIINDYIAHFIIDYGVLDEFGNIYQPTSFEQIVNDDIYLDYGNYKFKITAIITYEDCPYDVMLKTNLTYYDVISKETNTINREMEKLSSYESKILAASTQFYVGEKFFSTTSIPQVTDLVYYQPDLLLNYIDEEGNQNSISNITYDETMPEGQIIVDAQLLNYLTDNEFSNIFGYNPTDISAITSYMESQNLLNKEIILRITDYAGIFSNDNSYEEYKLKIVGYNLNRGSTISKKIVEKYLDITYKISSFKIMNLSIPQASLLLTKFQSNQEYSIKSVFTYLIENATPVIQRISTIAIYSSIGLSLLLILTIILFIYLILLVNKKSFKLLIDLGLNKNNLKYFIYKVGVILYLVTLVPVLFITKYLVYLINNQVTNYYFKKELSFFSTYKIKYLFYDYYDIILIVSIVTICFILATIIGSLLIPKINFTKSSKSNK